MNRTKIEWVKNPDGTQGYTWNPITGCLNGCEYCYARRLANTRLRERYLANENVAVCGFGAVYIDGKDPKFTNPFYPRFWPDRLRDVTGWLEKLTPEEAYRPSHWPKSRGIFVCDMSDLFGIGIPDTWTRQVLNAITANSQHRFYLLTKQPQNLIKWSPFPENCYVGVTATDTKMFYSAEYHLRHIEAKVKYVSYEPMLKWDRFTQQSILKSQTWLNLLIIGGKAGKDKFYPPEEWIQEIEAVAGKAGIPVFEKDNLRKVWDKSPRHEMPEHSGKNARRIER